MRGGGAQKMSVFVHAQGIKTVHAGWGGQKMAKFCPRSCWMPPSLSTKFLPPSLINIFFLSRRPTCYLDSKEKQILFDWNCQWWFFRLFQQIAWHLCSSWWNYCSEFSPKRNFWRWPNSIRYSRFTLLRRLGTFFLFIFSYRLFEFSSKNNNQCTNCNFN